MSLYEKLRKRYHSQSGMYLNKKTCADLEVFINQRVIEELESQMELAQIGNSYTRLRDRVKELKTK